MAEVESDDDDSRPTPLPRPVAAPEDATGAPADDGAPKAAKGGQSYYYWHNDAERRRQLSGEARPAAPTPQKLEEATGAMVVSSASVTYPLATMDGSTLVTSDGGATWTALPVMTTTLAAPAPKFTAHQLFTWGKYVSPPRGWPQSFAKQPLKEFVAKQLKGQRIRLVDAPHPLEVRRMETLEAELRGGPTGDPCGNAVTVRRLLGWDIIGGFALLETSQGQPRREAVEKPEYHGEPHWWNVSPKGQWIDLTPRDGHAQLVLVESRRTRVPEPSAEELEAMREPAKHADVLAVDFHLTGLAHGDVELKGVVLARKQLDGVRPDVRQPAMHRHAMPHRARGTPRYQDTPTPL